jgi:hypothetical protein
MSCCSWQQHFVHASVHQRRFLKKKSIEIIHGGLHTQCFIALSAAKEKKKKERIKVQDGQKRKKKKSEYVVVVVLVMVMVAKAAWQEED